MSLKNVQRRF